MSSWLPSIFNSDVNPSPESSSVTSPSGSVKEDLNTLLRGVAAFLAPPPSPSPPPPPNSSSTSSSRLISGIKNDLADLQGSFKSSLSLISSKFSSNLSRFQRETNDSDDDSNFEDEEEEEYCVVGITEEVVDFVSKISSRPELWTDFPILLPDDFDMSEYQREHTAEIEHLVSSLVNLRQRISSQISHGKFWMIYFILLFPRFNEEDLKLLATPEIVEVRDTLLQKLQNKNVAQETFENSKTDEDDGRKDDGESRKHNMPNEAVSATRGTIVVGDVDSDHRSLKDHENEDEFSFSDLEDDKNDLSRFKSSQIKAVGSPNEPKEWVELNGSSEDDQRRKWLSTRRDKGSESDESNDWFTVSNSDL